MDENTDCCRGRETRLISKQNRNLIFEFRRPYVLLPPTLLQYRPYGFLNEWDPVINLNSLTLLRQYSLHAAAGVVGGNDNDDNMLLLL